MHIEKAFELGTQFPHDIMTGDFTSRASSDTTHTIIMQRVKGFQRYLANKLKMELYNPILQQRHDAAILHRPSGRVAFTTDSYVIDPMFFPGGNIGTLAVNGTVNDLAMVS